MFSLLARLFRGPRDPQPTGHWHVVSPDDTLVAGQFRTRLAGVTFTNWDGSSRQAAIRAIRPGTPLRLLFEDNNPKDANAVAVYAPERQIGYLPRDLAEDMRGLAARGYSIAVSAYMAADFMRDDGSLRLGLVITIEKRLPPPKPREKKRTRSKPASKPNDTPDNVNLFLGALIGLE